MAWFIVEPTGLIDKSGSSPWHVLENETIVIRDRREMAIHGELLIEGAVFIKETGRLRVQS